jgi:FkbM family methyltransferase
MRDLLATFRRRVKPPAPTTSTLVVPLTGLGGGARGPRALDLSGADRFMIGRTIRDRGIDGYEPEVLAMLCAIVQRDTQVRSDRVWFLDIGANIGFFSLMLTSMFPGMVRATAFEPLPDLARFIESAVSRNHLDVEVREIALSNRTERSSFYVSRQSDTSNSLNATFRPHKDVIDVEVSTLDALYPGAGHGRCVLKVDTESTEPEVLEGARVFIEGHRPAIVCEVLAGRTEDQLQALLSELEYFPIHITDAPDWSGGSRIAGDPTYRFRDWLFAPEPPDAAVQESFAAWYEAITQRGTRS